MSNRIVALKPVKDLLGMRFHIPDYQRGYRWEKQQAEDLLNDIWSFTFDSKKTTSEIYCIQPLVVQKRSEEIMDQIKQAESVSQVEEILKGSWDVVDGQQRLTTIFLIFSVLEKKAPYTIEYDTREKSKEYLENVTEKDKFTYIDFHHIYLVHKTINEWLAKKEAAEASDYAKKLNLFKKTLLEKVNFIWYEIDGNSSSDAIAAFTRLNIGKIPLTDSELIKALFLNRSKYAGDTGLDEMQHKIALEWDKIEYALQNEEFWLFIHNVGYSNPTRIDFILDMICNYNWLDLDDIGKRMRQVTVGGNKIRKKNSKIKDYFGNDEHTTFRYFYRSFNENTITTEWLKEKWGLIYEFYQILNEWYHDYKLYHYIGYLTAVYKKDDVPDLIAELIAVWKIVSRQQFVEELKYRIIEVISSTDGILDLDNFVYEEEYNNGTTSKRECVPILLLHNIETVIQQNNKLVSEKKYALPDFSKFPFHLYKSEKWDVEHIRPNAGDKIDTDKTKRIFLLLAQKYIEKMSNASQLVEDINKYLAKANDAKPFDDIYTDILQIEKTLGERDKNKIWNYVLLDSSTNKEYSNSIFPIKRAFLAHKERGKKIKPELTENGYLVLNETEEEIAFVPPCTRNVFAKFYTDIPSDMLEWTEKDAQSYLDDIKMKLKEYLEYYKQGGQNHE